MAIAIFKKASDLQNPSKSQLLSLWYEVFTHLLVHGMHRSLTLSPHPNLYSSNCLLSYLLKMFTVHGIVVVYWYSWTKFYPRRCRWIKDLAYCIESRWAVKWPFRSPGLTPYFLNPDPNSRATQISIRGSMTKSTPTKR